VKTYNGPGNASDDPNSMIVDASENVYVVGFSYNLDTNMDYVTIMYNSSGGEQWVQRYNG
jgi:hypothetical protein